MDRGDLFSERGARVERSTRLAGVLLLIGAVLAIQLTEYVLSRSPDRVELFESFGLAARVLAPAGAMLIATSMAARALTRPFSSPSARTQLVTGLALLTLGLLQMSFGPEILAAISDYLGATGSAGATLVGFLAQVVSLTALPLGIALLATQPLIRLAQMSRAHAAPTGPPNIESLD
jgi:hypothetical protein